MALVAHTAPDEHAILALAGPLFVMGLGSGAVITPNQALTLADVDPVAGSTAGGVLQTAQRVGLAIGQAVIGAVFFSAVVGYRAGGVRPRAAGRRRHRPGLRHRRNGDRDLGGRARATGRSRVLAASRPAGSETHGRQAQEQPGDDPGRVGQEVQRVAVTVDGQHGLEDLGDPGVRRRPIASVRHGTPAHRPATASRTKTSAWTTLSFGPFCGTSLPGVRNIARLTPSSSAKTVLAS